MATRPPSGVMPANEPSDRPKQLRRASKRLAAVLESLELDDETRLADAVVEAIRAMDRACELETGDKRSDLSDEFVIPRK